MKNKNFFRDLKIFIRYIIVKPFLEIWEMIKMFYRGAGKLDKPYFWVKFFAMMTVLLIFVGITTQKWVPAYIAAFVMFIALLRFEWISGRFRRWHLENIKKKAIKEANKNGE